MKPFLDAPSEARAQEQLANLIYRYADPIINAAIHRYAPTARTARGQGWDADDLRSEARRILLGRIRAIRERTLAPIADFLAYTKVTARHLCWRQLRQARREVPFSTLNREAHDASHENTVSPFAEESIAQSITSAAASVASSPYTSSLNSTWLRHFWSEICLLPKQQRAALLLNFRDKNGASALPLLVHCGAATQSELAHALGAPLHELEAVLDCLPMEDRAVGVYLGKTAREVINLRLAARRRLTRRASAWLDPNKGVGIF